VEAGGGRGQEPSLPGWRRRGAENLMGDENLADQDGMLRSVATVLPSVRSCPASQLPAAPTTGGFKRFRKKPVRRRPAAARDHLINEVIASGQDHQDVKQQQQQEEYFDNGNLDDADELFDEATSRQPKGKRARR